MPQPLYSGRNITPAYQLRYSWSGWPSSKGEPFSASPPSGLLSSLMPLWETDGLRLLEHQWSGHRIQLTLSAKPDISPVDVAARIKGRLQHALRTAGCARKFSRKVSLRGIGHNRRETVEKYVRDQATVGDFADPRFAARLDTYRRSDPATDLDAPTETASGRYWYNLHLVLVTSGRHRIDGDGTLTEIAGGVMAIAAKKGCAVSEFSLMPAHLHLALRGDIARSPQEIALAFQNNLAYRLGQIRVWEDNYYVGTFGTYDMGAVRPRDGK